MRNERKGIQINSNCIYRRKWDYCKIVFDCLNI